MAGAEPAHYSNVVAFLATAGIVAPLVKRLRISPILGFLAAGVLLGPQGLGRFVPQQPWLDYFTVAKPEQISDIAELGVVFLLFSIGLELSFERLRLMWRQVFGFGAGLFLLTGGLIAVAATRFGLGWPAALAVGAALAMSSTAIGLPAMAEAGRLHARAGRSVFAVLLFQDLMVAPLLIAVAMVAPHGGLAARPLTALAIACAGLAGIILVGRLLLRPLFRSAARSRAPELFMALSLLVVIGAGLSAELLGLSMALGAFVAGLLLAETEYRHEVEVQIEPFKDLLLGLFFVSVGLGLNLSLLLGHPVLVLGVAAGLLALKAVAGAGLGRLAGLKWREAVETALVLASGGEFAFVVLAQAGGGGLVPPAVEQALVVSATLTLFLVPPLAMLGARIGRSRAPSEAEARLAPPTDTGDEPRALLIGYGRVGQLVGEMLERHGQKWVAIDRSTRSVEAGRKRGAEIYYGDASRPELLLRCGLQVATAVVLTTDEPEAAEAVTAEVRRLRPDVVLVARARDARHARRLYELGASDAVPETIEASLQLSEAVLVDMGVPMGPVIASIHEKRDEIRRSLRPPSAPTPP